MEEGSCLSDPEFNPPFTKPNVFPAQFQMKRPKLPKLKVLGSIIPPSVKFFTWLLGMLFIWKSGVAIKPTCGPL